VELLIAMLDKFAIAFFVAGAVALPLCVIRYFRQYRLPGEGGCRSGSPLLREGPALRCWRFMFIAFLCGFALLHGMTSLLRREVVRFIGDAAGDEPILRINGEIIQQPAAYLSELAALRWYAPHHSHPERERIQLEIMRRHKSIALELGRDSQRQDEYWVFYPKYTITTDNEIGRIRTTVFDEY